MGGDRSVAVGELSLREVLEAEHDELYRQLLVTGGDGDDDVARECLSLILDDSAGHLRDGAFNVGGPVGVGRSRR